MKRGLVFVMMIICSISYAQNSEPEKKTKKRKAASNGQVHKITYVLNNKKKTDEDYEIADRQLPYSIREKDAVQVRIKNVNPFLYSVSVYELQGDQISPETLQEGSFTQSLTVNIEPIKSITFEDFNLETTSGNKEFDRKIDEKERVLFELNRIKEKVLNAKQTVLNSSIDSANNKRAIEVLNKEQYDKEEELFKLEQSINSQKNTIEGLRGLEKSLLSALNSLAQQIDTLNYFIIAHNQLISIIQLPSGDFNDVENRMNNLFTSLLNTNKKSLIPKFYSANARILENIRICNSILSELNSIDKNLYANNLSNNRAPQQQLTSVSKKEHYKEIQSKLASFKKEFTAIDRGKIIDDMQRIIDLVDEDKFSVFYEVNNIVDNADFVRLRFELNPIALSGSTTGKPTPKIDMTFQIRGGAKFDVSSGFVCDFGLNDPSYYFDRTTDPMGSKAYIRKSGDSGNITPSIALFLNGYGRTSANFKVGGVLGIGLSNNARFRLYLGPSLIIGRKERIVLTGGLSFGAISRLADGYKEDQELTVNPSLPNEVPTLLDKYQLGGFLGVGFNLTGKSNKSFLEKIKFK